MKIDSEEDSIALIKNKQAYFGGLLLKPGSTMIVD